MESKRSMVDEGAVKQKIRLRRKSCPGRASKVNQRPSDLEESNNFGCLRAAYNDVSIVGVPSIQSRRKIA